MNGIALSVYLYVWQQKRTAGDESKNLAGTVSDKHYSCYYNHIQNFQTYMPDILNTVQVPTHALQFTRCHSVYALPLILHHTTCFPLNEKGNLCQNAGTYFNQVGFSLMLNYSMRSQHYSKWIGLEVEMAKMLHASCKHYRTCQRQAARFYTPQCLNTTTHTHAHTEHYCQQLVIFIMLKYYKDVK